MSETTPPAAEPTVATDYTDRRQQHRLHRALAWVGIVAGVVFIVAVIFFTGFFLGRGSGGYHGWHRFPGGQGSGCPMMQNGGMMRPGGPGGMEPDDMGPGMTGPGMMPGMMGPGAKGPGPSPSPSPQRPS